ncbi:sigma-E processing peptidase SpoIIGA [Clostridium haemolyticum]|uniref:Sporulation sigma-E factor-processing peptidase n=1 Tax=Clostridium haemolyticum NCTC 9693 TaxID=1443114 RepID=A0ABR4TG65_CLOHA|nr:sigma-E processing peptidase SpoIIGA [Clostridium haemolyticum]KEI17872.1 sporulation sigma-E factor-processing peptidase [Clostridium haemolyticum NCTC 9693]KGN03835.1 sporulation sigma-E factor-processing peptidase [Clostridium haemolyticum NCTC 8350]
MILYLDIFILENFMVNFFLLYITTQTLRLKQKILYVILASIIGTAYAMFMVYSKFQYFFNIPLKFFIAIIMILIVFRKKNLLFLFKATVVFIIYSMLLAGICIFIEINGTNNILVGFSYKYLILAIMFFYIVIHRLVSYIRDRNEINNFIYEIDIVMNDITKKVKAFLDTGNELREPVTNLPVMIVEKSIIPISELNTQNKFIIPYRVVNGFTGKLEGFKPKYIEVHKKNTVEKREVIIALCDNGLSELNDYNALLSRGII